MSGLRGSIIPMCLLKHSLLHEMLYTYLDAHPFSSKARQELRGRLTNHATAQALLISVSSSNSISSSSSSSSIT